MVSNKVYHKPLKKIISKDREAVVETLATVSSVTTLTATVGNIVLQVVINGSLAQVWGMLNGL